MFWVILLQNKTFTIIQETFIPDSFCLRPKAEAHVMFLHFPATFYFIFEA